MMVNVNWKHEQQIEGRLSVCTHQYRNNTTQYINYEYESFLSIK